MPKRIALVDSREQLPLHLPINLWKQHTVTLPIGDYSTTWLLGKYAVERKALPDFIRTFGQTREQKRFRERTAQHPDVQVDILIEAPLDAVISALKLGIYCSRKQHRPFLENATALARTRKGMLVFGSNTSVSHNADLLSCMLLSR